jgi:hypothetical protein
MSMAFLFARTDSFVSNYPSPEMAGLRVNRRSRNQATSIVRPKCERVTWSGHHYCLCTGKRDDGDDAPLVRNRPRKETNQAMKKLKTCWSNESADNGNRSHHDNSKRGPMWLTVLLSQVFAEAAISSTSSQSPSPSSSPAQQPWQR